MDGSVSGGMNKVERGRVEQLRSAGSARGTKDAATLAAVMTTLKDAEAHATEKVVAISRRRVWLEGKLDKFEHDGQHTHLPQTLGHKHSQVLVDPRLGHGDGRRRKGSDLKCTERHLGCILSNTCFI